MLSSAPRKSAETLRKLAAQTKAILGEETATAESGKSGEDESAAGAKEKVSRKQYAALFDLLVTFYRDLLALRVSGIEARGVVNSDRLPTLARLAQSGSPERWLRCLDALLLSRRRLDANANVSLVTESLLMRLLQS